ncbi:MAG TPA: hypothetical protein VMR34_01155 [Candidatus Saccharimonadales bacterium]|nr:hypothetical protein [Candidatus Saccharimonadales bacterium]
MADTKPQIVMSNDSYHNDSNWNERLEKEKTYRDLSTLIICPTRGVIPSRVVANWQYVRPMNQKIFGPIFMERMEVATAYNQGIKMILEHPDLSKFKYILTIEEDNYPQYPDGLLKLYEGMDKYDCVGGLYWTKGEGGQPMCYGDPNVKPLNFIPRNPTPNELTPCNGLGMGFNLWRLKMFKDKRFKYGEWFKTMQNFEPNVGVKAYTQDLYFFEKAVGLGYKFACDARVPVVHWDEDNQIAW